MALPTWNVALIADSGLDASMFQRLLDKDRRAAYVLTDLSGVDPATALRERLVDILIVSMEDTDPRKAAAIRQLTAARPDVPVMVVYGGEDDTFGTTCTREGAADAMHKRQLNATTLRLSIAAVIGRLRANEARLAERRAAAYELVGHHVVNGWLCATQGWDQLLRKRNPERFAEAVDAYGQVLVEWVRNKRENKRQSRAPLRHIAALIERLRGRPADVVDIHAHAVAMMVKGLEEAKARGTAMVAHSLALEIVGRLEMVKDSASWLRAKQGRRTSGLSSTSHGTGAPRRTSGLTSTSAPRRTSGLVGGGDEAGVPRGRRISMGFDDKPQERSDVRRTAAYNKPRRTSGLDVVSVSGRRDEK